MVVVSTGSDRKLASMIHTDNIMPTILDVSTGSDRKLASMARTGAQGPPPPPHETPRPDHHQRWFRVPGMRGGVAR